MRVIFKIPPTLPVGLGPIPSVWPKEPLAYVEWYSTLKSTAEPNHNMYVVKTNLRTDGQPVASIIPLSSVRQSCMLIPQFGRVADKQLTSQNVLDRCTSFLVNNWTSMYTYQTVW